jgi:hypothetical protein
MMSRPLKFSQLSPPRKALVRLCQSLNYGSILNVKVVNGEVTFDLEPQVIVDIRLDEEVGERPEAELADFTLRVEHTRLFAQIDLLKNGSLEKVVVHGGIPRRVTLRPLLHETCREIT